MPKTIPDRIYRDVRDRPLLVLRLVRPTCCGDEERAKKLPPAPVVGWGISFPTSEVEGRLVEYVVNTLKMRELFGPEDDEEEAAGDLE